MHKRENAGEILKPKVKGNKVGKSWEGAGRDGQKQCTAAEACLES